MSRSLRLLPLLAALPILAACEPVQTVAVQPQPAPVFPAPEPQPEPPAALSRPESVTTQPLDSEPAPQTASAPPPAPNAITASGAQEGVEVPEVVLSALVPGTPPSAVFQNGDGCYLFSIERTEPLSGYPVRDASGAPLCENDDGTVGPRPAS
ncbi:hypothetical protein [Limimaricola pyoseonensis]|uniref:Uncharacterized protein n=1 Tax=Limimaricola pyoseonensis TaxID=521013 RepID=A0A1G7I904_9RHOB|nr:hypothetical protein [Limimaricola pyoseonensis]SDF09200.1 hypothetical protein SAMN04488567_3372 [Limimaricola pyoseonensis]